MIQLGFCEKIMVNFFLCLLWQEYETNQTFHTAKTITPYASTSAIALWRSIGVKKQTNQTDNIISKIQSLVNVTFILLHKFPILRQKIGLSQARSQKFVMGRGCLGGLGAEPPALENFAFFCKNNFILGLFWLKNNAFETWLRNWQCKHN